MSKWGNIFFREGEDFRAGAVFVVDKPLRWTSFDVVNKVRICLRKGYGKIKVGHAGTLDPLASGVVIICVGKETKKIEEYMGQEKEYVAEITFGHTTPSYDLETSFDGEFSERQDDLEINLITLLLPNLCSFIKKTAYLSAYRLQPSGSIF